MPIKYVPFYKESIKGQALLDNFVRTRRILKYEGNNNVYTDIQRGMPYYEVLEKEKIGNNNNNLLIRGECISACAYLKEKGIKVDLVYIDPPFSSGADYAKKIYIRKNPKIVEKIKDAKEIMQDDELKAFEEKMYGDIWNKEAYLNWMYENLCAIKSIMSDTASIYVHLDWNIDSYVRILLDEIFGEENFRNEIIWGYRIQGVGKNTWARKHNTIYFYSKSDEYIFNAEREDNIYESKFIDTLKEKPDMSKLSDSDINRIITKLKKREPLDDKYKKMLFTKYYSNVFVRDVWDCDYTKPIISGSSESVGYITQKPEGLLKRIINGSTNKGMIVADFFGGSGVTAKVANDLGRNFIHVDVGINSIQTTRDRLVENNADFKILEINDGINLYRNPIQTMDKIKDLIPGLKNDDSLNNFWEGSITDTKNGKMPVYLPNLVDSTSRILDIGLINRIIHEALLDLDNNEISKVIIYYVDINNKTEIEDYIKQNNKTNIEIELRDLKFILNSTITDDQVNYSLHKTNNNYEITIKSFKSDKLNQKIDKYNDNMKVNKKDNKIIQISDEGLELIEYLSLDCTNEKGIWHSDSEIKIDKFGYITINGSKTKKFWDGKITSNKKPLRLKIRNISGDELITLIK